MISATMLSAYLYCRRKLFLERVLKMAEPEKEALILGKIRHIVFERAAKDDEGIVRSISEDISEERIADIYRKSYSKIARNTILTSRKDLERFGLSMLDTYHKISESLSPEIAFRAGLIHSFIKKEKVFGDELFERLTPKIRSETYIESPALGLKGIIDKIEVFDGEVIPVELKTGKAPSEGVWPGHMVQIGAYILLLEDAGKKVPKGIVHYLDARSKREIVMNPFLRDEIIELARKVDSLLKGKIVPDMLAAEGKCAACGIREMCHSEGLIAEKMKERDKVPIATR